MKNQSKSSGRQDRQLGSSALFATTGRGRRRVKEGMRQWIFRGQSKLSDLFLRFSVHLSRSGEQCPALNQVCSPLRPESGCSLFYSGLLQGGQSLTWEEMEKIKNRSADYSRSLLGGRDEIPLDDLSDIGLMCVVDIPRLLGKVMSMANAKLSHEEGGKEQL